MNSSLKSILKEISTHATTGRVGLNENTRRMVTEKDIAAMIVDEYYKGRYTLAQIVAKLANKDRNSNSEVVYNVTQELDSVEIDVTQNGRLDPDDNHEEIEEAQIEHLISHYDLQNLDESKKLFANKNRSRILKEISSYAKTGRLFNEAEEEDIDNEEDPLGDEDPLSGGPDNNDPLANMDGGNDPMGMGGDVGIDGTPETDKIDAEGEKATAEADAAKAEADAAKAKADKEKSAAEKEMADAKAKEFNGTELYSRPGVSVLVGLLLDKYQDDADGLSSLAGQLIAKLRLDDKGVQKLKSQWGPMIPLQGSAELMNNIENQVPTDTDADVDAAVQNS